MPINVLRFRCQGRTQWGVVGKGAITPIPGEFPTTRAFLEANKIEALTRSEAPSINERDVELLSPVTENQQFLCQGANYRQHMIESGMDPDAKAFNMIFTKAASCIAPADTEVVKPSRVRFLDYEIELGLVLKRDVTAAQRVTNANLHEFVAGATIVNDYSARDVQIPQMQFYKGKSFRTFGPSGPTSPFSRRRILLGSAICSLTLTVNGETRQKDSHRQSGLRPCRDLDRAFGRPGFLCRRPHLNRHTRRLRAERSLACAATDRGAAARTRQVEDVHERPGSPQPVFEARRRRRGPHRDLGRRDRPRRAAQSHRQRGGLNASGFRGERRPPNRARGEPDVFFGLSQVRDGEHLASVGTGLRDRLPRWPAETITIQWICENLAINQMAPTDCLLCLWALRRYGKALFRLHSLRAER